MKSILFIAFTTLTLLPGFHAQNSGLYGKKTYVEINGLGYSPMFSNFFNKNNLYDYRSFKVKNNSLIEKKDRLNYGFRIAIGRALKRNFAVGFEAGFDYSNISTPYEHYKQNGWDYGYYNIQFESLDIKTLQLMPKIEFSKEGGLLPLGLNHQIGFGFNTSQVVERDYKYKLLSDGYTQITQEDIDAVDQRFVNFNQKHKGFTLMYAFNIRTPITKNLLINYGIRYTLNLRRWNQIYPSEDKDYVYSTPDVGYVIGRTNGFHFLTFNIGATFAF